MEKDFHHHIIYALAKLAGFDKKIDGSDETEAEIIAYASQYVDDNCNRSYTIQNNPVEIPDKLRVKDHYRYYPTLTQAVDITAIKLEIQKYVFMPFHFLPGDYETVKINGISNPYCTTKNSANANKLLDNALKSGDPYRIGIALHTFADTWSHQRFTAFNETWNKVMDWYKDFKALAPDIGHADVWHLPDQICKKWRDHRFDEDPVENKKRAFEAAGKIYKKLRGLRKGTPWTDIKKDIEKIIYLYDIDSSDERKVYDERKKRIEKLIGELLKYDKDKWIADTIEVKLEETDEYDPSDPVGLKPKKRLIDIWLKDGFEKSHWYKFQIAAKTQLSEVFKLTANL